MFSDNMIFNAPAMLSYKGENAYEYTEDDNDSGMAV